MLAALSGAAVLGALLVLVVWRIDRARSADDAAADPTTNFDYVFFAGDLNYRLGPETLPKLATDPEGEGFLARIGDVIDSADTDAMAEFAREHDQLERKIQRGAAFASFDGGTEKLRHPPTFRTRIEGSRHQALAHAPSSFLGVDRDTSARRTDSSNVSAPSVEALADTGRRKQIRKSRHAVEAAAIHRRCGGAGSGDKGAERPKERAEPSRRMRRR